MVNSRLELINQVDFYVLPTLNGIGITISPEGEKAMFNEYNWKEIIDSLLDSHTVTVLKDKDVRLTYESKIFLLKIANNLRLQADIIENKIKDMNVIK